MFCRHLEYMQVPVTADNRHAGTGRGITGQGYTRSDEASQFAGDAGDASMLEIFDEIVGPAAERFKPDIILVTHPIFSGSALSSPSPISLHLLASAAARAPELYGAE